MSVVQPKGYYTYSSYIGILPDGTRREFVSDTEYYEAFSDAQEENEDE